MTTKERAEHIYNEALGELQYAVESRQLLKSVAKGISYLIIDELSKLESELLEYNQPYSSEYWWEVRTIIYNLQTPNAREYSYKKTLWKKIVDFLFKWPSL